MNIDCRRHVSQIYDCNCYVVNVSFEDQIVSIVIDPCVDYNIIKKDLKGEFLGIFITHGHFDHFKELSTYENTIPIYLHKKGCEKLESEVQNCSKLAGYNYAFNYQKERFKLIGAGICTINTRNGKKLEILVVETPGHSDCSICLIIDGFMFTGDCLFKGSIGRCDLYSGDELVMKKTLKKLKTFHEDYVIYPGHGDSSTLGDEFLHNKYLRFF